MFLIKSQESPNLQAASNSLVNLVQIADKEVADVMIEMAKKTADLYKEFIPLLSLVSLNGKTVTVNNVNITINKEITQEQFQVIFNRELIFFIQILYLMR